MPKKYLSLRNLIVEVSDVSSLLLKFIAFVNLAKLIWFASPPKPLKFKAAP